MFLQNRLLPVVRNSLNIRLNFVVAMLLLVFVQQDPETAESFENGDKDMALLIEHKVFWMLVALIDHILPPEMYGQTLEGVQIQVIIEKSNIKATNLMEYDCARKKVKIWV